MARHEVLSGRWRLTLFRVLAVLLGAVYLPGGLLLAAPWMPSSSANSLPPLSPLAWARAQAVDPDLQRWTFALSAVVDEAIAAILVALAWRPLARPLPAQTLALALVVDVVANVPFDPEVLAAHAFLLLLLLAYPAPRRLLTPFWRRPIDRTLGAMAIVVGVALVPSVWQAWQAQIMGADELARNCGWASTVEHLCNLWLMALLAASRKPGATLLAALVAACFGYLGVAAIAVPGNPGGWGIVGGAVAIAGAAAYVTMTARALRRPAKALNVCSGDEARPQASWCLPATAGSEGHISGPRPGQNSCGPRQPFPSPSLVIHDGGGGGGVTACGGGGGADTVGDA